MSYRDTASFGKRIEYQIIGEMLKEGLDVYIPLVDDHGVDCIVKRPDGQFVEIQIKARSKNATRERGSFSVTKHNNPISNYYFIFYSEKLRKKWIFSSQEFIDETKPVASGKNKGKRKIYLFSDKFEENSKYNAYLETAFNKIIG